MEQNFYRDDFEQMLKDTSEEFRMYPSRKVWHSIYNDFHPDRKWPSFTVCLVLLTSILYIGISNNNNISKNSRNLLATSINTDEYSETQTSQQNNLSRDKPNNLSANSNDKSYNKNNRAPVNNSWEHSSDEEDAISLTNETGISSDESQNLITSFNQVTFIDPILINIFNEIEAKDIKSIDYLVPALQTQSIPLIENDLNKLNADGVSSGNILINNLSKNQNRDKAKVIDITNAHGFSNSNLRTTDVLSNDETAKASTILKPMESLNSETSSASEEDKVWLEDFAFHNKKNKNKWKSHLSIQYYITPSLGYRELYKNNDYNPANGGLLLRTSAPDLISQHSAVNLETGATLLLDLNKRLSFKTGIQFNLTNYVTNAHKLQHPSQTTVLMNDLNNSTIMPVAYNSYYGNVLGSNLSSLNNKTYQVSIPIGLNYKLAGSDKLKWYVGGTVQPTLITGGNAYLISTDNKNFVEDPSMLRSWNLNSSLETFASIKTPSGISINVGPQFRYQLLSSYSKQYTYTEKLFNVGIKLGITKKL